jgi:methyl-accepting chemotaxis protein
LDYHPILAPLIVSNRKNDEVRNLAMRAAEASKSTESLIQRTIGKVREGSRFVEETGTSLSEVVATTAKAKTFIEEIAAGSKERVPPAGVRALGILPSYCEAVRKNG